MKLYTERLILRSFLQEDAKAFGEMHADPDVMRYLGGARSQGESDRELQEIMEIEAETGLIRFALERKGSAGLVGFCGLKPAGKFIDLSYMIARDHWRQGYAFEAAKRVREFGLIDMSITNMEAGGDAENVASIKILEQLAFTNREELLFNNRPAVRFFD